jgi:hypothetical protein
LDVNLHASEVIEACMMNRNRAKFLALNITIGLAAFGFFGAQAQEQYPYPAQGQYPQQYPQQDAGQYPAQYPPASGVPADPGVGEEQGRGVARLSVMNGDVSVRRGDAGEWVAAAMNAPVMTDDRVLTGDGSRAEIQMDWGNMMRVGQNSEVRIADLENRHYQFQIAHGTIMYRVLRDADADVELSTPAVSVRPVKRGAYRITVNDDGSTEITVRAGEVEIYTPRGSQRIPSGRTAIVRGNPADPEFQIVASLGRDEWDIWNERRDHDLESSRSYQYVSPDIYGAEDLDQSGTWVSTPDYGNVWAPTVPAGWAPYRNGRWVWIDYYGWNWVSYDPWGWAPYHYGRWFERPGVGWCWYPGGLHARHYWSPALVAFFGFGHGGVGLGFGNVGWVPLAPREPYYRWYGRGYYSGGFRNANYVNNRVNITNVNITNIYRNARNPNGITGIDSNSFGRGRIGNTIPIRGEDLRQASLVRGQLPFVPGRESLRMSDRAVTNPRIAQINAGGDNNRFFARRQPTPIDRVPFEQQRRGVEQATHGTFGDVSRGDVSRGDTSRGDVSRGDVSRGDVSGRTGMGGYPTRQSGNPVMQPPTRGSEMPRAIDPRSGESMRQSQRQADIPSRIPNGSPQPIENGRSTSPDNGWRRFGEPGPSSGYRGNGAGYGSAGVPIQNAPVPNSAPAPNAGWRQYGGNAAPYRAPEQPRSVDNGNNGSRNYGGNRGYDNGYARQPYSAPPPAAPQVNEYRPPVQQPRVNEYRPPVEYRAPSAPPPRQESVPVYREAAPAPQNYRGGGDSRSFGGFGRSEAPRSSPPIVRERAPERPSGNSGGGGGGSHQSGGNSRGDNGNHSDNGNHGRSR